MKYFCPLMQKYFHKCFYTIVSPKQFYNFFFYSKSKCCSAFEKSNFNVRFCIKKITFNSVLDTDILALQWQYSLTFFLSRFPYHFKIFTVCQTIPPQPVYKWVCNQIWNTRILYHFELAGKYKANEKKIIWKIKK